MGMWGHTGPRMITSSLNMWLAAPTDDRRDDVPSSHERRTFATECDIDEPDWVFEDQAVKAGRGSISGIGPSGRLLGDFSGLP